MLALPVGAYLPASEFLRARVDLSQDAIHPCELQNRCFCDLQTTPHTLLGSSGVFTVYGVVASKQTKPRGN